MRQILCCALLALVCLPSLGHAQKKVSNASRVENAQRGQIVLLKKAPPPRFASQKQFAAFLKAQRMTQVPPKDKNRMWQFDYMAFLRAPARDVELRVKIYDVTENKRLTVADTIYTRDRNERVIVGQMALEPPDFAPQRKYQMYLTDVRNVVLAQATFSLGGKKERYSGKVTFSEEETKGP